MFNYLNGTNYDSSQPWGNNWADWSSAGWGNGWAGTAGGVARQLGLEKAAMAEFVRAVNNQRRRLAETAGGGSYGYKPDLQVPAWIQQLYQSKGMNTGGITPTGKSGVGKYVDLAALQSGGGGGGGTTKGRHRSAYAQARDQGLTGRAASDFARNYNNVNYRQKAERETGQNYGARYNGSWQNSQWVPNGGGGGNPLAIRRR